MRSLMQDVAKFHRKFGRPIGAVPVLLSKNDADLRIDLIAEEAVELVDAIKAGDLTEIADGMGDLIYVIIGAALEFGIDLHPVWNEIQKTNMAKDGGATRADGKILKPDGWVPPNIHKILADQKRKGIPLWEKLRD
jgi:predicted HAD superfamily Cof-like phosphohydrolase